MLSIFIKHPREVCMSYVEHFQLSIGLSTLFLEGSIKAIIHAFFPFWYPSSSTRINLMITDKIKKSGCRSKIIEI